MNKGIKKLIAYVMSIVTMGLFKMFGNSELLNDNNFMSILITSNVLFTGSNIAEHAIDKKNADSIQAKEDEGILKIDGNVSLIERKLIAFLLTFVILVLLIALNKLGQDAFTYCFMANIGLFITGNIAGDHLIDKGISSKITNVLGSVNSNDSEDK